MANLLRTRALVEGALFASLTALLGLAGIYLPVLRIISDMLWTIPLIVVTVRHGPRIGTISLGVAGILILALAHPLSAVFLVLQLGGLAIFYGVAFRKGYRPAYTLAVGTGVAVLSLLLVLFLTINFLGFDLVSIATQMEASIEPTIQLYNKLGFFEQNAQTGLTEEMVRQILEASTRLCIMILPAIFLLWALATAVINYLLAQVVLLRLNITVPVLPSFRKWRLPWWTSWGFILGFAIYLLGDYFAWAGPLRVGINIMLLYAPILFILGLSVVVFYGGKYCQSRFGRFLIIIVALLFFRFVFLALMVLGLLDLLLNYRQLPFA